MASPPSTRPPAISAARPPNSGNRAAITYVHGFTGSGPSSWSDLAPRLCSHAQLGRWDGWTLTYASSWLPDISGIWSADAKLEILALRLASDLAKGVLERYEALVLIAHSMGGLVVQKALVDHPEIAERTHTVILFGTPSAGLAKARSVRFWKRQLADMARGGPFISQLRADWTRKFDAGAPFRFLAVAGEKDQFVPPESSIAPFPADQRAAVAGNHVTMIHPAPNDPGVLDLVLNQIVRPGIAGNLADSALVAIELGDFRKVVRELLPQAQELDPPARVHLAIALDGLGRRDDAYEVLAQDGELGTDEIGALAGRLKRRWLFSGRRRADALNAEEHYAKAYALALERDDLRQAYYHGINLAFLAFVFRDDRPLARRRAREVLAICARGRAAGDADEWLAATEGEARLILDESAAAFAAYRAFVAAGNDPWKIGSTYLNARMIAAALGDRALARELGEIFDDPKP
jgi:pimeloyl-ACP methyl ester carboxylesterase